MRSRLPIIAAVSLLVLAACSSRDEPDTATPETAASTTDAAVDDPATTDPVATDPGDDVPGTTDAGEEQVEPPEPSASVVTFGEERFEVTVDTCTRRGEAVRMAGGDDGEPTSNLVAYLSASISASSAVYTLISDDNSFVTYMMGPDVEGQEITGSVDGDRVTVSGLAVKQERDPAGELVGEVVTGTLTVETDCTEIR